jgi:CubicO group peptidase (beta-lactamase class C family)
MATKFERSRRTSVFLCGHALITLITVAPAYAADIPDKTLAAKVDAYIQPYVDGRNFSGAILIARKGRVLFAKGYGMANYELAVPNRPDTRFHIASISKSFTAAAILILEERGQLQVKDTLAKFIPDYPQGDKITVHHLLTHTSGIPNVNNFSNYAEESRSRLALSEIIALFKDTPLEFQPGARFRYSNSNYNLLAFLIEKVSGKKYGEFLEENIFRPLQMNATANDDGSDALIPSRASGYVPAGLQDVENAPFLNWSIKIGNGSLYSTVEDLYKWDRALYSDVILKKSTRDRMFTDYGGFGYGWFVRKKFDHRVIAINGRSPGFTSSLDRFIDDDVAIILAANTYSGMTQSMADDIAAIVFEEKYSNPPRPVNLSADVLGNYAGRYQFGQDFTFNPGATVTVENIDDTLRMVTGESTTYLLLQSETKFVDRLFGGMVTFTKGPDGKVTGLTWNFGSDFKASRIQ